MQALRKARHCRGAMVKQQARLDPHQTPPPFGEAAGCYSRASVGRRRQCYNGHVGDRMSELPTILPSARRNAARGRTAGKPTYAQTCHGYTQIVNDQHLRRSSAANLAASVCGPLKGLATFRAPCTCSSFRDS